MQAVPPGKVLRPNPQPKDALSYVLRPMSYVLTPQLS